MEKIEKVETKTYEVSKGRFESREQQNVCSASIKNELRMKCGMATVAEQDEKKEGDETGFVSVNGGWCTTSSKFSILLKAQMQI